MLSRQMRAVLPTSLLSCTQHVLKLNRTIGPVPIYIIRSIITTPPRSLAQVRPDRDVFSEVWFTSSPHTFLDGCSRNPKDAKNNDRTLKLGESKSDFMTLQLPTFTPLSKLKFFLLALRLLQSHLPSVLASPLPQEILSPRITLHLFPSTHPHLPAVSGRVAYHAALWSAPVAWGRVPIVGNVKLVIISERMVKSCPSLHTAPTSSSSFSEQNEKLIVRWKTSSRSSSDTETPTSSAALGTNFTYRGIGSREQVNRFLEWLSNPASIGRREEEFCGLFIFEFDEEGRVVSHTIEHAEENGGAKKASRVVNLTDWLLGRARAGREQVPELAWLVDGEKKKEGRR